MRITFAAVKAAIKNVRLEYHLSQVSPTTAGQRNTDKEEVIALIQAIEQAFASR
jgi:hypothetical protein